jgi:hypothetical protein
MSTNKVAIWHSSAYGFAVHILGEDGFPAVTLGTGQHPLRAIEDAQSAAARLVRGLQAMHDKESKGKTVTV